MTNVPDKIVKSDTTSSVTEGVLEQGQLLGGKYKVISELGTGGMGTVYRVQQVFLHKEFALKTMHSHVVSDVLMQRFQLEAQAAASLNHPNLVHVHDFGVLDDGQPYLVMDLVDGITLAEYLKEQGPMPVDLVAPVFAQACFGLLAAHDQGVVHRDIKPSNIMVVSNVPLGTEGSVKVLDFGIAKLTSNEAGEIQALTRTGEIFGSPLYMSPEQCTGGLVDHRSDIYSLGCVLFEMLTGTPPYLGQNALSTMMLHESGNIPTLKEASLGKDFPDALQEIVEKMLRKAPAQRYQNIGLVAHDLAAVCQGSGVITASGKAKTISAKPERVVSMPAGRFYLLMAMTALISVSISGLGGYLFRQSEQSRSAPTATGANLAANSAPKPASSDGTDLPPDILVDTSAENRDELRKFGPIASKVLPNGDKKRFVFPNCGIGLLCRYTGPNPSDEITKARGTVDVPIWKLTLKVNRLYSSLEEPGIFDKIDAKEFYGLNLDADSLDAKAGQSQTASIAHILNTASHWSNLEFVYLDTLSLNKSGLEALSNMKRLRYLDIVKVTIPKIVHAPLLCPEEVLLSRDRGDVEGIVRNLAGSPNLGRLTLDDDPVTFPALQELLQCKQLKYLQLKISPEATDQFIRAATQFKSLKEIFIKDRKLTDEQIQMLINCRWLTTISLSGYSFSDTDRVRLKKLDARIAFQ